MTSHHVHNLKKFDNTGEDIDVIKEVDLKIEKSKIYRNLDILDEREEGGVVRFRLDIGGEERTQREITKDLGISRSMCRGSRRER